MGKLYAASNITNTKIVETHGEVFIWLQSHQKGMCWNELVVTIVSSDFYWPADDLQ